MIVELRKTTAVVTRKPVSGALPWISGPAGPQPLRRLELCILPLALKRGTTVFLGGLWRLSVDDSAQTLNIT